MVQAVQGGRGLDDALYPRREDLHRKFLVRGAILHGKKGGSGALIQHCLFMQVVLGGKEFGKVRHGYFIPLYLRDGRENEEDSRLNKACSLPAYTYVSCEYGRFGAFIGRWGPKRGNPLGRAALQWVPH